MGLGPHQAGLGEHSERASHFAKIPSEGKENQ